MRRFLASAVAAAGLLVTITIAPAAVDAAKGPSCGARANKTIGQLLECVTVDGASEHLDEFQEIADANGNTRVSGSPGYDLSADYAEDVFAAAGLHVTRQNFQFQTFVSLAPSVLEQVAPPPTGPIAHTILTYSGSGDVTAAAATPTGDNRGCFASDWAGFPAGAIALVLRGTPAGFPGGACTFAIKATNAAAAGAAGVVILNNAPGAPAFTLGNTFTLDLPVVGVTQDIGATLVNTAGLVLHIKTSTLRGIATTSNVLAETPWGDPNNVVMVGAHLDSVNAGPGIQDNGTGSAAVLEVAEHIAKSNGEYKVRFALWGAEESNLVGSTFYVNNLSQAEKDRIQLYLNFDMIGSPNYVFFVYDGDDSDAVGAGPGPTGSADIEKTFERFYTERSLPFKGTDFSGRSDYGPFIAVGIPSGGLFTGAEVIKTAEEAAIWGGTAGLAFDPCYHQACDTIDNVNDAAFDVNLDAVAYATLTYAFTTVEGAGMVPGAPNPPQPAAPVSGGGVQSGLHDDEPVDS